jgi:plastocyanin
MLHYLFIAWLTLSVLLAGINPIRTYAQAVNPIIQINFGSSSPANFQFYTPSYMEIQAGTTVTWRNNDAVAHTVTLLNPQLKTNVVVPPSEVVNPNTEISYIFNIPGVYDYYCTFYPFMLGRIVVK